MGDVHHYWTNAKWPVKETMAATVREAKFTHWVLPGKNPDLFQAAREEGDPDPDFDVRGCSTLQNSWKKNHNTLGLNISKNRRSLLDQPVFVEY